MDQALHARLHVGEWLVIVEAKIIEVLEQVECNPESFLGIAKRRFQFQARPAEFRV